MNNEARDRAGPAREKIRERLKLVTIGQSIKLPLLERDLWRLEGLEEFDDVDAWFRELQRAAHFRGVPVEAYLQIGEDQS